ARWHDAESPWHWNFSLLEAESLTALARLPEADAILNCEPPRRPEFSQQRVRLLIDRANLRRIRGEDAAELLREARESVVDNGLAIQIELLDGTLALDKHQHARAEEFYRKAL